MADWCKLYENEFDHEELRWALTKQPHCGWVYAVLLTRCARDKTGNFNWSDPNRSLFALADACVLTPPVVNDSLNALKEIGFIEITEKHIKVLSWNKKQSDWCRRTTTKSLRSHSGVTAKSLQSNSEGTTPRSEERRSEKKREEKSGAEAGIALSTCSEKLSTLQGSTVLPTLLDTPEFRTAWDSWLKFRKTIKHPIALQSQDMQLLKFQTMGATAAIAQIEQSIANGWRGLFPVKDTNGYTTKPAHPWDSMTPQAREKDWKANNPNGSYQRYLEEVAAWEDAR